MVNDILSPAKPHNHEEQQNIYAFDVKHEPIHISEAKSGRRGYYCMGCDREMQAVKSRIAGRASYFRHDPKDVQRKGKCTYSDETYRHKLAKEILVRLKQIRVPAVYKYPPTGEDGLTYLIRDSETIFAHRVEIQRHFFETDEGEICWGSQEEASGKNLLIIPDVIFFNKENEPILLIELVVKHKLTDEKKLKIRRLGINTVQVRVPKDSPEEIERTFSKTDKTKWVFNYEQEITDYIRISQGNSEGISLIDEIQRQFFEENYRCRASQIGNLVRAIKRCLESKPYRQVDDDIRSEISRVERNAESNRERLQRIQEGIDDEIYNGLGGKRESIRIEENGFRKAEDRLFRLLEQVRQRYKRKGEELDSAKREFDAGIADELEKSGITGITFSQRKREIEREIEAEEFNIGEAEKTIKRVQLDTAGLPTKYKRIEERTRTEFAELESKEIAGLEQIEERRRTVSERFAELRTQLEQRFEQLRKESAQRIKERNIERDSGLPGRIKELLSVRGLLINYVEMYGTFKRNRKAWESFKSGTYKNWNLSP
ncbi:MAG TPA: hypothetical protein PLM56_05710 [Cyclobacteriaceae bacterium]|nr:hypothetical protein [Cyclobacteriaceae bacterium]